MKVFIDENNIIVGTEKKSESNKEVEVKLYLASYQELTDFMVYFDEAGVVSGFTIRPPVGEVENLWNLRKEQQQRKEFNELKEKTLNLANENLDIKLALAELAELIVRGEL